jgi:hypothetical protein
LPGIAWHCLGTCAFYAVTLRRFPICRGRKDAYALVVVWALVSVKVVDLNQLASLVVDVPCDELARHE